MNFLPLLHFYYRSLGRGFILPDWTKALFFQVVQTVMIKFSQGNHFLDHFFYPKWLFRGKICRKSSVPQKGMNVCKFIYRYFTKYTTILYIYLQGFACWCRFQISSYVNGVSIFLSYQYLSNAFLHVFMLLASMM